MHVGHSFATPIMKQPKQPQKNHLQQINNPKSGDQVSFGTKDLPYPIDPLVFTGPDGMVYGSGGLLKQEIDLLINKAHNFNTQAYNHYKRGNLPHAIHCYKISQTQLDKVKPSVQNSIELDEKTRQDYLKYVESVSTTNKNALQFLWTDAKNIWGIPTNAINQMNRFMDGYYSGKVGLIDQPVENGFKWFTDNRLIHIDPQRHQLHFTKNDYTLDVETLVVDRRIDKALQREIKAIQQDCQDVVQWRGKITDTDKKNILQNHLNKIFLSEEEITSRYPKLAKKMKDANSFLSGLKDFFSGENNPYKKGMLFYFTQKLPKRDIYLGDFIDGAKGVRAGIGVCRHRALMTKVLGDSIGLKMNLINGKYGGTPHTWTMIKSENGDETLFDPMLNIQETIKNHAIQPQQIKTLMNYECTNGEGLFIKKETLQQMQTAHTQEEFRRNPNVYMPLG